ncbi:MAG: TRC40/GET3/ArsA family transport-energizing ATPase [Deltaproteobacteria bacterium]|nr:TRC40/GET3/ArsA family transport-energizing ATPase [Deltaproteobacteria bacterium]MBW2025028.1 TRC40/GET3/ArsA family transport-energizing ATPase [Deltaproteobacteria bacterium]MBW2124479.1 TRC40/GET3/ArsA family transport-energizing ATPase [Deltaproteobacteria bacterium]RLB21855.1 MAG: arsenic transporter [Deltaproteobacteria bacterium]
MGLADIFEKYPNRQYIMFGGKGGLGKTTFSAATAYYLAKKGKRVLVFSVDPQASLSDIFERDIFGKGNVEILPNLYACEVDADKRIRDYQEEIRQKIISMYGMKKIPEEIESYIRASSAEPAMEESAIFDAVVDIVVQGDFDYYIYDLVPLGHALYYLSMASIYDAWLEKITALREKMREYDKAIATMRREEESEEDQIYNELMYIKERIGASSKIMTDREKTAFFFVLTPEEMIIADTEKAGKLFAKYNVPLAGYVVNRVLDRDLLNQNIPQYLKNRIETQSEALAMIEQKFGASVLAKVPEFDSEIKGLETIRELAEVMFEEKLS